MGCLGRRVGVAASTIRGYAEAHDAEADGVLALIRWLDIASEKYVASDSVEAKRLHPAGGGYVRVEMEAVATADGDPLGANGRTRITIQDLVDVAKRWGQPVASLTRFSEQ